MNPNKKHQILYAGVAESSAGRAGRMRSILLRYKQTEFALPVDSVAAAIVDWEDEPKQKTSNFICGCGGIGRRVRFRFLWSQGCAGSSPVTRTKNPKAKAFGFFICVRRTQHHWAKPTSFVHKYNIIFSFADTNERCCAVSANEVALRANEVLRNEVAFRQMMLRSAQTELSRSFRSVIYQWNI